MTTEQAEAQAALEAPEQEVPDQAAPPVQESEVPAEPTLAELQGRLAEANRRAEKAESDFKSIQGRNRPMEDMKGLLETVIDRQDASERAQSALIRAIGSGDTDGLPAEVAQIQTEASARQGSRTLQQFSQQIEAEIAAALVDDDGNTILDQSAPELEKARQTWAVALEAGDRGGMASALLEVNKTIRRVERGRNKSAVSTAWKEGQEQANRERARQDADLDTGGGVGGGGGVDPKELGAAFAADPYNPKISKAYHEMRQARGL